jgi:hypothetical protein
MDAPSRHLTQVNEEGIKKTIVRKVVHISFQRKKGSNFFFNLYCKNFSAQTDWRRSYVSEKTKHLSQ